MVKTTHIALRTLWANVYGQDLIEYALMAGAIVVVVAGFLPPMLMPTVSEIFSKLGSEFAATSSGS